jgi:hypothetical protein
MEPSLREEDNGSVAGGGTGSHKKRCPANRWVGALGHRTHAVPTREGWESSATGDALSALSQKDFGQASCSRNQPGACPRSVAVGKHTYATGETPGNPQTTKPSRQTTADEQTDAHLQMAPYLGIQNITIHHDAERPRGTPATQKMQRKLASVDSPSLIMSEEGDNGSNGKRQASGDTPPAQQSPPKKATGPARQPNPYMINLPRPTKESAAQGPAAVNAAQGPPAAKAAAIPKNATLVSLATASQLANIRAKEVTTTPIANHIDVQTAPVVKLALIPSGIITLSTLQQLTNTARKADNAAGISWKYEKNEGNAPIYEVVDCDLQFAPVDDAARTFSLTYGGGTVLMQTLKTAVDRPHTSQPAPAHPHRRERHIGEAHIRHIRKDHCSCIQQGGGNQGQQRWRLFLHCSADI